MSFACEMALRIRTLDLNPSLMQGTVPTPPGVRSVLDLLPRQLHTIGREFILLAMIRSQLHGVNLGGYDTTRAPVWIGICILTRRLLLQSSVCVTVCMMIYGSCSGVGCISEVEERVGRSIKKPIHCSSNDLSATMLNNLSDESGLAKKFPHVQTNTNSFLHPNKKFQLPDPDYHQDPDVSTTRSITSTRPIAELEQQCSEIFRVFYSVVPVYRLYADVEKLYEEEYLRLKRQSEGWYSLAAFWMWKCMKDSQKVAVIANAGTVGNFQPPSLLSLQEILDIYIGDATCAFPASISSIQLSILVPVQPWGEYGTDRCPARHHPLFARILTCDFLRVTPCRIPCSCVYFVHFVSSTITLYTNTVVLSCTVPVTLIGLRRVILSPYNFDRSELDIGFGSNKM